MKEKTGVSVPVSGQGEDVTLNVVPRQSVEEWRKWLEEAGSPNEPIADFLEFDNSNLQGLQVIMNDNGSLQDAMEQMLTTVYKAGMTYGRRLERERIIGKLTE